MALSNRQTCDRMKLIYLISFCVMPGQNAHGDEFNLRPPTVRLPAITSVMVDPDAPTMPAISIAELSQCVGRDSALRQATIRIKAEGRLLEQQVEILDSESADVEQRRVGVEVLAARVRAVDSKLSQLADSLDRRKRDIEKRQASRPSPAEARQLGADIDNYNADAARLRARLADAEPLRADHRTQVDDFNRRVGTFNDRQGQIRQQSERYQEQVNEFNTSVASANASCGGTHRIED